MIKKNLDTTGHISFRAGGGGSWQLNAVLPDDPLMPQFHKKINFYQKSGNKIRETKTLRPGISSQIFNHLCLHEIFFMHNS